MGEQGSGPNLFRSIPPPELAQQLSLAPAPQTGSDDPWSDNYVNPRLGQMDDEKWEILIRHVTAIIRHHGTTKEGAHWFDRDDGRPAGEPMSIEYIDSILTNRPGRHVFPPITRIVAKEMVDREPRFSGVWLKNLKTGELEVCLACKPSRHHRRHPPRTR